MVTAEERVEVAGRTYPVRKALAKLPGARFEKGKWTVPVSQKYVAELIVNNVDQYGEIEEEED